MREMRVKEKGERERKKRMKRGPHTVLKVFTLWSLGDYMCAGVSICD
jgi:hypothetical protein